MNPIDIIGMGQGPRDLTKAHLDIIDHCNVLVGGSRHLAHFKGSGKEEILITADIRGLVEQLKTLMPKKKIAILASGDPLFYGIGATLTRYFGEDQLRVHANISSISAAFSAIKTPWHDAKVISLHGAKNETFSFPSLVDENKIAFLTDPRMTPQFIADGMTEAGLSGFKCCVLENLGDETKARISWFDRPDQMKSTDFSTPNIVILIKEDKSTEKASHGTHLGMDETLFKHEKGLITKSEIRTISLSKLKLTRKDHILWDIGSGSGSIGIEASLLLPWGEVYAMEKHPERISDIIHNVRNFNCSNVKVCHADFPEGVEALKAPDRIFIGGGGDQLAKIIDTACENLLAGGIIVINTVLLQNLDTALKQLRKNHIEPQVVQIQISRSKTMPFGERMEALNPVWIISGSKS